MQGQSLKKYATTLAKLSQFNEQGAIRLANNKGIQCLAAWEGLTATQLLREIKRSLENELCQAPEYKEGLFRRVDPIKLSAEERNLDEPVRSTRLFSKNRSIADLDFINRTTPFVY